MYTRISYVALIVLISVCFPVLLCAQSSVEDTLKSKTLSVGLKGALDNIAPPNLFNKGKLLQFNTFNVNASYSYLRDTSGLALGSFQQIEGIAGYQAGLNLAIVNIPFDVAFKGSNGIYTTQQPSLNNLTQFNFNRDKYIESIRSKLLERINPDAIAKSTSDRIASIQKKYEQELQQELTSLGSDYRKQFGKELDLPDGAGNVALTDQSSLRSKLFSAKDAAQYQESVTAVQEMLKNKDASSLSSDTLYQQHLSVVKRHESLEKAFTKITSWQQKFRDNKLVKELKENLPFEGGDYRNFLSKPENTIKAAKENFNLSTLQRIFCNVTHLDLGQNPLQGENGTFSPQNLMNTGVNAGLKSEKASIAIVHGSNNNTNSWLQQGLTSSITNEYSSMTGLTLGTGSSSAIDQSIALNLYSVKANNSTQTGGLANYLPAPSHSSAVLSLHTGLPVGGKHKVELDLSKSFGSFGNSSYYDSSTGKSSSTGSLLGGGGSANYAGVLNYEGEIFETAVTAYIKKVGLGYNNPGNYLLRRGESQIGGSFNRQFYHRKLTVKYQVDYRIQHFDPTSNYSYATFTNKWQTSYRFKRNNKLGLSYQQSIYQSTLQDQESSAGSNKRWQLDGAYQIKKWRKTFMNNVTISWQQLDIPTLTGESFRNRSLLLTHTTSVQLRQNLLSLSVIVNHSNNQNYYFNTSLFSTEVNYSYTLSQYVRLASGIGYYANGGWNKQLGCSQQITATLSSKWDIDLQGGYKKSIQETRSALANQLYFNSNIRYHF